VLPVTVLLFDVPGVCVFTVVCPGIVPVEGTVDPTGSVVSQDATEKHTQSAANVAAINLIFFI
jgi:hypothetical protein